jgi:signal transduction histidine kinase
MLRSRLQRAGPAVVLAVALGLCATTVAIALSGSSWDESGAEAVARALMVLTPFGVGLYAVQRPPFKRFGKLLLLTGVLWFLSTLSSSDDPVLYSLGRVAGWTVEPLLMVLMLTFPSGRLSSRLDRGIVLTAVLVLACLYLPTALLVETYPVPVPWVTCGSGCPDNAFMVAGSQAAVIDDVIRPLRELLTLFLFVAVAVRLAVRLRGSTRLMRRILAPVLVVACLHYAVYGVALFLRGAEADVDLDAMLWTVALTVPLLSLAFLAGLARWWLFVAVSTQRLSAQLHGHATPRGLRAALATAFDDPGLGILYWLDTPRGGHWADEHGNRAEPPDPGSGRCLTEVRDGGRLVAGIVHDEALRDDRAFIDSATSYALIALDNQRLSAQTASLLREARRSRARIQSAADEERRRIERDLHDGAQQRLVALRIKLELAADRSGEADAEMLRALGGDVDDALEEVRSLARGIYPAALADRGLVEGLRAAALRSPLPVTVLAAGLGRYPRDVESAAYFCCLEALQNATKHATGATAAVIDLSDDGDLHLEVRDDGAGFDPAAVDGDGVGLTSMRDRMAAVGGDLSIHSRPGHGTRVSATIPHDGVG